MTAQNPTLVLTAYCANRAGIVAALSKAIFELGGYIVDLQQFDDAIPYLHLRFHKINL